MSSKPDGPRDTPERFLAALRELLTRAGESGRWEDFTRALRVGLNDERTRIGSFCILAELVMERLFVRRESEHEVQRFLVEDLHVVADRAALAVLMSVDAAKKAVDISESSKSIDQAVAELERDHRADPELARPMVETGIRFLRRESPSTRRVVFAVLALVAHPLVAIPIAAVTWLILVLASGMSAGRAALVAVAIVIAGLIVSRAVGAAFRADSRRA